MPADLPVPFQCRRPVQHIHAFEDGVCPVPPADLQHCCREPPVSFQHVIVHKHIQLIHSLVFRHIHGADAEFPVKQPVVRFLVKLPHQRLRDLLQIIGKGLQPYGPAAVLRMQPPVVIQHHRPLVIRIYVQGFRVVRYPPGQRGRHQIF